jgi:hypothetical protein
LLWTLFGTIQSSVSAKENGCPRPEVLSGWSMLSIAQYWGIFYEQQKKHPQLIDERVANTNYPIGRFRTKLTEQFPGKRPFAVVSDRFSRSYLEEISIPSDKLLCLVAPPATLLLSDGTANHYVSMEGIDQAGKRMTLADAWPEQSFLIGSDLPPESRGKLLEVPPVGGVLIDVPTSTVSSFLVGAIFLEDPDGFIKRLRKLVDLYGDAANLLAIGLTLYSPEKPETFKFSLEYLGKSVEAAKKAKLTDIGEAAKHELAYALLMSMTSLSSEVTQETKESYLARYKQMGGDGLLRDGSARLEDLVNLSIRFEEGGMLNYAYFYANLAVVRDASSDDAHLQRAKILNASHNYEKSLPDAIEAYRLNTLRIRNFLRDPKDDFLDFFYTQFGGTGDLIAANSLNDIANERLNIFQELADSYSGMKKYEELLSLGREVDRMLPRYYLGPTMRAEAEFELGQNDLAKEDVKEAIKRNPEKTDFIKKKLKPFLDR